MRSYNDLLGDVKSFLNRKDLDSEIPRFIMLAEQDLFRRLRSTCNETTVTYTADSVGYPINAAVRLPDSALELKSVIFDGIPLQYISDATYFKELHKKPPKQVAIASPDVGFPLPDDPDSIGEPPAGFPIIPEPPPEFPIIPEEPFKVAQPKIGELLPPELIADAELDRFAYPPWLTPKAGHYIEGNGRPNYFTRIQNYLCFYPIAEKPVGHTLFVYMYHFDGPVDAANPYTSTLQDAYPAYLYGALSHAEGYLMNDPRIMLWKSKFEECLQQMNGTKTDADLGSVQEVQSVYA